MDDSDKYVVRTNKTFHCFDGLSQEWQDLPISILIKYNLLGNTFVYKAFVSDPVGDLLRTIAER